MIFYAITSAGRRGRCWNPSLERLGFQHLPGSGFNTSLGAQQMLVYQKSIFEHYYYIKTIFRSKTLETLLQRVFLTCVYKGAEKHVSCEQFENAASRAKTNVIATVHFTGDNVSFYDGPGMLIRKTAKPCINSTWIALLIHGFVLVKAWLLIVCDAAFYAIIDCYCILIRKTLAPAREKWTTCSRKGEKRIFRWACAFAVSPEPSLFF